MTMDVESLAIAESLVALSKPSPMLPPIQPSLSSSLPTNSTFLLSRESSTAIPIFKPRPPRKASFFSDDEYQDEDGSPSSIDDYEFWRRPRLDSYTSESAEIDRLNGFNNMGISSSPPLSSSLPSTMKYRHSSGILGSSPPASRISSSGLGSSIGAYSPESRRRRIERYMIKRKRRVWSKKVDYDVRKNFADSRLRVKGRFVKKEDEEMLCHLMSFV